MECVTLVLEHKTNGKKNWRHVGRRKATLASMNIVEHLLSRDQETL